MDVTEYTELDFEHITLDKHGMPVSQEYCTYCGTEHTGVRAGIWFCDICRGANHKELTI